ncbi:nuclease A inhibitor family protein [Gloeothece verrucosa]|uniref:Nuclease A inhibitor family protein n=1 Tax=Gloeothece verrucosa (strain PCC 7822) TaxID=497965 RepID=E0ULD9_GLOV7|nr:nuclease A inhibitor family protein [Gloeothece verrucosa]ADN17769.1 Nuclease A inhibitor family protein [Gloeothece verrucosa PCC 7822]
MILKVVKLDALGMNLTTSNPLVTKLSKASEGLVYISESDYPYEVIHWDNPNVPLTKDLIAQKANISEGTPCSEVAFDDFFNLDAPDPDWYGEEEKQEAAKQRNLMKIMKDHLTDLKVYRFGEVEIAIYIVGKAANGEIIGLKTTAIET